MKRAHMIDDSTHTSIALLKAELSKLGYVYESMILDGVVFTQFKAPSGSVWLTADETITYPFTLNSTKVISKQKHLAYAFAQRLGVAIPFTKAVSDDLNDDEIDEVLKKTPLIVKPNDSSLAQGLTLNIHTRDELTAAITFARNYSKTVLCQQQISGDEVRIIVMDGTAKAALLRQSPQIVGDGKSTFSELVEAENNARRELRLPYDNYRLLEEGIVPLDAFDGDRILAKGEIVELRKTAMLRYGASLYNITETIHKDYLHSAEVLAQNLGSGMVAVDVFIEDYTQPQTDTNYAFIEFNTAPVLDLFYSCRDGNNYPVLDDLVPLIDKNLQVK